MIVIDSSFAIWGNQALHCKGVRISLHADDGTPEADTFQLYTNPEELDQVVVGFIHEGRNYCMVRMKHLAWYGRAKKLAQKRMAVPIVAHAEMLIAIF